MIRRALAALVATAAVLLIAGCGDEPAGEAGSETTPSPTASDTAGETAEPSPNPSPPPSTEATEPTEPTEPTDAAGQVIEITFSGDDVTPNGDRVKVTAGQPITLRVTADAPGELHVHSDPEQELEYAAGESTLELTIEQPGIVEVESHDLEKVIVQLEVRP